ncbi:hypothetical protein F4776DRAFT_604122 [Hypoxylon sp. NC0597]|nr:hypothetical protein F4776DRAFT_604122 [Hypoxylon sp. NC0597]
MSSSGKASRFSFVTSPPSTVMVNQEFRIKVRAPSSDKNGTMGFVSLASASSRSGELLETTRYLDGTLVGNWARKASGYDVMEFGPIKVTQPGHYHLHVHFYSDPKPKEDGEGQDVEKMGIAESEVFQVRQKGLASKGSKS